mmetsp:Transcript_5878/g.18080  ORF Transcript_5878/g.18080 Transcript_5878/m.18080 type:complete len:237 (-) Transcript_5878:135-845(-)
MAATGESVFRFNFCGLALTAVIEFSGLFEGLGPSPSFRPSFADIAALSLRRWGLDVLDPCLFRASLTGDSGFSEALVSSLSSLSISSPLNSSDAPFCSSDSDSLAPSSSDSLSSSSPEWSSSFSSPEVSSQLSPESSSCPSSEPSCIFSPLPSKSLDPSDPSDSSFIGSSSLGSPRTRLEFPVWGSSASMASTSSSPSPSSSSSSPAVLRLSLRARRSAMLPAFVESKIAVSRCFK